MRARDFFEDLKTQDETAIGYEEFDRRNYSRNIIGLFTPGCDKHKLTFIFFNRWEKLEGNVDKSFRKLLMRNIIYV